MNKDLSKSVDAIRFDIFPNFSYNKSTLNFRLLLQAESGGTNLWGESLPWQRREPSIPSPSANLVSRRWVIIPLIRVR